MNYWLWIDGEENGPHSMEAVEALAKRGRAGGLIRAESGKNWAPLGEAMKRAPDSATATAPDFWSRPRRLNVFGWAALIIAAVLLLGHLGGSPEAAQKQDAHYTAERFVQSRLKAPSTAKFSPYRESIVRQAGKTFTVTGWVEAQNSFGAPLRSAYQCVLDRDGERWLHVDTTIAE